MNKYIDADKLADKYDEILNNPEEYDKPIHDMLIELYAATSEDVVEVVRCENCEHWKCNPNTDEYGVCKKASYDDFEVIMDADDYCSYEKRKEENE